ncbi:DUF29 domain-containing protein [Salmonella enterica]|nr:DUF29 domain-containing protein [Salmonella enterica]
MYEKDFYQWTRQQAAALQQRNIDQLDFEHLIEEIWSAGDQIRDVIELSLEHLFVRQLQYDYYPATRGLALRLDMNKYRRKIHKLLVQNPSLWGQLQNIAVEAYQSCKLEASRVTGRDLEAFPPEMPYDLETLILITE